VEQAPRANLPLPPTALVGREQETAAALALLRGEQARLVTLLGPGGAGKTRLALEVAHLLLPEFDREVFYVELAAITDPSLVLPSIAQALGLREAAGEPVLGALHEHLRDRRVLLVLDNFEQVASAALQVAELLEAGPAIRVLVTSRQVLGLEAERLLEVPPLRLPDRAALHGLTADSLLEYPAVALFAQRARAISSNFELTQANAATVAEICLRLDGIPLAIELAAARIRLLSPQALLARLEKRLPLLTGGTQDMQPRHKTLRDTIAWSYELLDAEEQKVFRSLSVFAGGFTEASAEAILDFRFWILDSAEPTPIQNLKSKIQNPITSLVNKSLVRHIGESRLGMLETVREFAWQQLEESGELEQVRERHAAYFLEVAERAEPELRGAEPEKWLRVLDDELDNLRAALDWSLQPDPQLERAEVGLRIASALQRFWQMRGHLFEGQERLGRLVEATKGVGEVRSGEARLRGLAARARGLSAAGRVTHLWKNIASARDYYSESLRLHRELGNKQGMVVALMGLANVGMDAGDDMALAGSRYDEIIALWQELGYKPGIAGALSNRAIIYARTGDYEAARDFSARSLDLYRESGDKERTAIVEDNLGRAELALGNLQSAWDLLRKSMATHVEMQERWNAAYTLMGLAQVAWKQGRAGYAARLLGAAEGQYEAAHLRLDRYDRAEYDACVESLRRRLGEENFAAMRDQGLALSPLEALDGEMPGEPQQSRRGGNLYDLSARQVEVLQLVAQGLSDAEVADRLFLSKHTVNAHLRTIYSKIGVSSRSAAARFAMEQGLV
jgi:predicted ATPase/DNA-binding CsgD family transcriptional regulator